MKPLFVITFILLSGVCCAASKEIEKQAQDHLERSFEHVGLGVVEIGVGVFEFSKGDPVGGAAAIGAGIKEIKDGVADFNQARDLFEQSRNTEREP